MIFNKLEDQDLQDYDLEKVIFCLHGVKFAKLHTLYTQVWDVFSVSLLIDT